ncbi:MAG TPA: VWA domain-containing protein [Vicinamibacterales bacterium]|nr:VWA domain-containing protein [Vicinamibacterales bacterium]
MTQRFVRWLVLLFAVMAGAGGVLLRGQAPPQQPPTFRGSIDAVQLSVIVTDREGNPVSGLTEDDFEILEDGKPRPITTFAAVNIPIERTERTLVEKDVLSNDGPPGRLYVIALDQMAGDSALRTRAFLRRFVEGYFGPNDTAAVVLTTQGSRESGQEFTSNPRLLLSAIDKFDGGSPDMSGRLREKNFIGDFKGLMQFMATLRGGRKAVIFVSQNIPVDAYDVVDRGRARFGGLFSEVDTDWIDALSFATRNNIAVYPIDPRGLTTGVTGESEDGSTTASQASLDERVGLGGLAAVTGGFALTSSNNYTGAFERLVRENSTYYLLAFNSGVEKRDGRYVRLDVRVKRPGLQVRSTEGYVQPRGKQQEPKRPPTSAILAATWDAVASAITTSGVSMRVNAAAFKGRGKEAIVPITVELSPEKLNLVEENGAYRGQIEIVFAVTDSKKRRFPIWRHRALLALKPETYERVSKGAMRVVSQMPLPEGHFQIRASAGSSSVAGSVIYDLEVPDFRDDFELSGVTLTSKQARETFTFSPHRIDVALPGPPTTAREFSRDDALTLFTEAYENRKKPHTVTLTLELRSEDGRVIGSDSIDRKSVEKPKDASVYAFAPNLSLEDVPPGRYAVHVEARSSLDKNDKKKSIARDIPFSVR